MTEALRHRKNFTKLAAPLSSNVSSIKYRIVQAMCCGSMANECSIMTRAAAELGKHQAPFYSNLELNLLTQQRGQ